MAKNLVGFTKRSNTDKIKHGLKLLMRIFLWSYLLKLNDPIQCIYSRFSHSQWLWYSVSLLSLLIHISFTACKDVLIDSKNICVYLYEVIVFPLKFRKRNVWFRRVILMTNVIIMNLVWWQEHDRSDQFWK